MSLWECFIIFYKVLRLLREKILAFIGVITLPLASFWLGAFGALRGAQTA